MRLQEILVRPVCSAEESRFQDSMRAHHYLGALPKIGNTIWYVACFEGDWVALISFSAAALKCAVRDDVSSHRKTGNEPDRRAPRTMQ